MADRLVQKSAYDAQPSTCLSPETMKGWELPTGLTMHSVTGLWKTTITIILLKSATDEFLLHLTTFDIFPDVQKSEMACGI
jgi:hypothetical protein